MASTASTANISDVNLTEEQFTGSIAFTNVGNRGPTGSIDLSKLPIHKGELRDSEHAPNWLARIVASMLSYFFCCIFYR
jgi:hypothetical protein